MGFVLDESHDSDPVQAFQSIGRELQGDGAKQASSVGKFRPEFFVITHELGSFRGIGEGFPVLAHGVTAVADSFETIEKVAVGVFAGCIIGQVVNVD
jgi:hypothetical protein